jgi:hypothetical protein
MAYTIRIESQKDVYRAHDAIVQVLTGAECLYRAKVTDIEVDYPSRKRNAAYFFTLKSIRLRKMKPYCGNHPGECFTTGPRPNSTNLEWDDWVAFNGLVNDTLDGLKIVADVWSKPREFFDKGRTMWIRRMDLGRRVKYEWEDDYSRGRNGVPARIWDHGTDSQFDPIVNEIT